jgi:NAD(P)-dependent dehydrogenase (short-subunit alcohol dehydrogenase family)
VTASGDPGRRRFEGRVVLVTGAASGIGAASALRLAQEGAQVFGADLAPAGEAWGEVERTSPDARLVRVDVREEAEVERYVADAFAAHGRLDGVLNAAGVAGGGPVHLVTLDEWHRVLAVNLTGTFLVCKHAVARMLERRSGSIVNVASIEGLEGAEGGSAYNASKGGVVLLTRNMAMDYGRRGIRVNCLCPGLIDTPMARTVFAQTGAMAEPRRRFVEAHQLGRAGRAEEVAAAAAFLLSDDASFVSGHALPVDGGLLAGHRYGVAELMGLA